LGDAAAAVGVAEEFIFCFHLAKANAAPTTAAIDPTIAAVTSTIYSGSIGVGEGVGAYDVLGATIVGLLVVILEVGDVVVVVSGIPRVGLMVGIEVESMIEMEGVVVVVEGGVVGVLSKSAVPAPGQQDSF